MNALHTSRAMRVALLYAAVVATWVVTSDQLVTHLGSFTSITFVQTAKGWLVVAATSFVLYRLLRHESADRAALRDDVLQLTQELHTVRESRTDFLTALAHELRTPLTSVLGLSQTLANRFDDLDPARAKELVERLARSAEVLSRTVTGADVLSAAAPPGGGHRRETDVSALARSKISKLRSKSHVFFADAGSVRVYLDPERFELVLDHLLGNVLKHTPAGTFAWVRCELADGDLLLTVEDDGPGVADPDKQALFLPFEQRHVVEHSPGMGIGLAVVSRLAAVHGGRAWVQDRPEGGAAFIVVFPQRRVDACLSQTGPSLPLAGMRKWVGRILGVASRT